MSFDPLTLKYDANGLIPAIAQESTKSISIDTGKLRATCSRESLDIFNNFEYAAADGRFVLPRCPRDGFFYYPRTRCPQCLGNDWSWEPASGRGKVYSFTVDRVGHDPGQRERLPLIVAIVELDEVETST